MEDKRNLPAKRLADRLMEFARENHADEDFGTYIKFKKGRYYAGADEIELGHGFIAHADQTARGFVKFVDNKLVDKHIVKVVDGCPPDRNTLDDLEVAGTDSDPWSLQTYLPLVDPKSGQALIFVTSTFGGRKAIGVLCQTASHNLHLGNPIIRLRASSYNHKAYGFVQQPVFEIVGWAGGDPSKPPAPDVPKSPVGAELDDEIPF
jgi:hypothetical protein